MLPVLASAAGSAARCSPAVALWQRAIGAAYRLYTTAELQVQVEPLSQPNEGISVINLSRPGAKNAIGRQLLRELQEAINTLRQERTTRCVIVRSTCPGTFCAGADLKVGKGQRQVVFIGGMLLWQGAPVMHHTRVTPCTAAERATMTQAEAAEFVSSLRRTFTDLSALPMPSIAVLEGAAFGGGAELALACDLRVADTQALLALPETRLGIMPGAGGTQRLPRLIGLGPAKELIFTAKRVGAPEAVRLGLLDHCVDQGKALDRALELAREIAQCAPLSLRAAKAAINQGVEVDLCSGLKLEEALYAQLLPTRDRIEGLKAFAEKRQPVYTGE